MSVACADNGGEFKPGFKVSFINIISVLGQATYFKGSPPTVRGLFTFIPWIRNSGIPPTLPLVDHVSCECFVPCCPLAMCLGRMIVDYGLSVRRRQVTLFCDDICNCVKCGIDLIRWRVAWYHDQVTNLMGACLER